MLIALAACCLAAPVAASEVVVVCPEQFRDPLDRWLQYRRDQGLSIAVIESDRDARALRKSIAKVSDSQTRYVVLVGDAPVIGTPCNSLRQVPVNYAQATVTSAWGSTPTLATDLWYGDFDADGLPDAAVGRMPVDNPAQLQKLVDRIIAHELSTDFGAWRGQVQLTGGIGGFGLLADTAIESVTRTLVTSVLPAETRTSVIYASPGHRFFPSIDTSFTDAVLDRYQRGSRFWVYAGHGQITSLDRVPRAADGVPVLDQQSVKRLARPAGGSPIAVMLACYTGALDAAEDSLAEEMLLCDGGPIAVFAGSRVTMPYGNCTAALGLIEAVFERRPPRLGDAWLSTLQRMHSEQNTDAADARTMIDALAAMISPAGTTLLSERREHMQLYNLIGDPTLKLHHPQAVKLNVARRHDVGQAIECQLESPIAGDLTLSFDRPLGAVTDGDPNQTTVASIVTQVTADQLASPAVILPAGVTGPIVIRAIVSGEQGWATAAARTILRLPAE